MSSYLNLYLLNEKGLEYIQWISDLIKQDLEYIQWTSVVIELNKKNFYSYLN